MNNNKRAKIILIIDLILLLISFFSYKNIYATEKLKIVSEEEAENFMKNNKEAVFSIDRIIVNSSAYAVDNSEGELQNIDISQFTDILVYIDNTNKVEEITPENTVNEMYIDNIKIEINEERGEKSFNYKNPLNAGKYVELSNFESDGLLFKIINTNQEGENISNDEISFFTDCSNPISLGFVNKNILTGCSINRDSNGSVGFDGTILGVANLDLKTLSPKISFTIHIVNNYNEKFVCAVTIDNDLTANGNSILTGNMVEIINTDDARFNFIKVN